jgi:hypothetical protein
MVVQSTPMEWKFKRDGRPTTENITKWVKAMEASCLPGGCNAHLGIHPFLTAQIVRTSDKQVLASWNRSKDMPEPLFQVI